MTIQENNLGGGGGSGGLVGGVRVDVNEELQFLGKLKKKNRWGSRLGGGGGSRRGGGGGGLVVFGFGGGVRVDVTQN